MVLGLVMASKGKGHKSGRGRGAASENEEFELEDDQVDGEPPEARAYRRLPFGVHRYDPIHPPVPRLGCFSRFSTLSSLRQAKIN